MTTGVYTSEQLVQLTGVGIRTFRHWIAVGILPGPRGRGPAARYDEQQLHRVRLVQALRAQGARLDEIKRRLSTMTPQEVHLIMATQPQSPSQPTQPRSPSEPTQPATAVPANVAPSSPAAGPVAAASDATPAGYRVTSWDTIELMPGLLLMVGQNRGELVHRLAKEIWQHYGSSVR